MSDEPKYTEEDMETAREESRADTAEKLREELLAALGMNRTRRSATWEDAIAAVDTIMARLNEIREATR